MSVLWAGTTSALAQPVGEGRSLGWPDFRESEHETDCCPKQEKPRAVQKVENLWPGLELLGFPFPGFLGLGKTSSSRKIWTDSTEEIPDKWGAQQGETQALS